MHILFVLHILFKYILSCEPVLLKVFLEQRTKLFAVGFYL
jgi:hypothetical protein